MCYGDDARPPLPPISGAAADHGDLTLTSSDGTKFMAYFARASRPKGAGMIVLPDVRGLHRFFKELAQRFAEAGIDAVAIDYFARTAKTDDRSDSFDSQPHVQQTSIENTAADVGAAMSYLRSPDGGAVKSLFTVGFCFGGSNSWSQSAFHPDLSGCIGFYGRPMRAQPFIAKMRAPLMIMVAGNDAATTPEQSAEFERELTAAGVPHEQHVYKGAPHSFFDRTYEQWKDASDDAWRRMLEFVDKHSERVPASR
jgi:carboxymethylenebutenolidase